MDNKYEHAKFLIERFDHYYDAINNKGSFYIGLNTFILGGICAGYISIANKVANTTCFWMFLFVLFTLCIVSIFYTISAISPFLSDNENKDHKVSRIFFGSIAKYNLNTFLGKVKEESDNETNEDMYRQAHCLASGLASKFQKLRIVGYLVLLQFITIILFSIYLIKNYTL